MKTHLTPLQLFLLTFLYVFSGITLCGADSLLSLLLPIVLTSLWAVIGYRGAEKRRTGMTDFLSAYLPERETSIPLAFFLFTSAAETVVTLLEAGAALWGKTDFIPFSLVLFALLGIASLAAWKGTTVLGRFAEMTLFLLVPFAVLCLFGDFRPIAAVGTASDLRLAFSVMPAPVIFLLSVTAVSGDEGTTEGFRATGGFPKNRAGFLVKTVITASFAAAFFRALLLTLPLKENNLLVYFSEYAAHVTKLSLLVLILARGFPNKKKSAVAYVIPMVVSAVFTLAVIGGAVFSPFLWILLLVALNATVCGMLFVFALR
jgi:hypothetical protein